MSAFARGSIYLLVSGLSLACAAPSGKGPASPGPTQSSALLSALSRLFPAANGTGVCVDAQLRLAFKQPVILGESGKIQIFKASKPGQAVASVDLAATDFTDQIGGRPFHVARPVFIDGSEVVVYLPSNALA